MLRTMILGLFATVALQAPAAAQGDARGAAGTLEKPIAPPFSCDRLGVADGLPSSEVRAIVQDKLGFLWFGTADGLARYDGIRFYVYRTNPLDPKSLSSGFISALALDATGKLWVGTTDGGVDLYDPDTDQFTRYGVTPDNKGLSSEGVTAIVRDAKGRMWFAMGGGGVNRFEPDGSFTHFLTPPLDSSITALAADGAGNLWLGTDEGELLKWNPDTKGDPTSLQPGGAGAQASGRSVLSILVATNGAVWVGTEGDGLFALDPAADKWTAYHAGDDANTLSDNHVFALYEDATKALWIGTDKGVNHLDASGKIVRYQTDVNDPRSLSFPQLRSIYRDVGGVMWLGGLTGGICKFREASQRFGYHHTQGFATKFYEDTDGTLWVGCDTCGLRKYDRKRGRLTVYSEIGGADGSPPLKLTEGYFFALHRDRKGILWLAIHGQGLVAFDPSTGAYQHYRPDPDDPNSLPVENVTDLWEDKAGLLWLTTLGGGLVKLDPVTKAFTTYKSEAANGLTSDFLYSILPDPKDDSVLWIGTAHGGLVRFNRVTGAATSFRNKADKPDSLGNDDVLSTYVDPAGIVWVGTFGGGLNRLDPSSGAVERFTMNNSGLTNNTVLGILPDDDGKLWVSTSGGGLLRFDPKTKEFIAYTVSDGLQDTEFGQGAFLRSKTGELFFGGAQGFNAFFPKDIARDTYVPPVVPTAFMIGNRERKLSKPIWAGPEIKVSYTDSFELQFAALSYAEPKKNRYKYKLEGYDKDFIETDRPFAPYSHLGGGTYTLRVRAANQHGVWNETGITLKLAVTPPFWRTWPAYAIYILVLVGGVFAVFWVQRQRLQRAERDGRLAVVEQDLALTAAVQTGFLPENNEIRSHLLELFGFYRPADACSGDWWWHEQVSNTRHLVLVGDVTGHGAGPAMVTAAVATAFRVLVGAGQHDLEESLALLNREVLRVGQGKYHMTMAALEIDESTGRFKLYSAGAPPMLRLSDQGKHRVVFCPGAPLGTAEGFELGTIEGTLKPTERLLLYTDGMPEIDTGNGQTLGMRRFAQLYESTREHAVQHAAAAMVRQVDQLQAAGPQADDWTFALIEWGGGGAR